MNCEHFQQQTAGYALGALDDVDASEMAEHLADGCEKCAQTVSEFEDAAAQLSFALPPVRPPDAVEQRLFDRIGAVKLPSARTLLIDEAARSQSDAAASHETTSFGAIWPRYAAAAAVLLAVGSLSYVAGVRLHGPTPAEQRAARGDGNLTAEAVEEIHQRIRIARAQRRDLDANGLRWVALEAAAAESSAWGYVAADLAARQWHLYAFDLEKLPPGRRYQTWLVREQVDEPQWTPVEILSVVDNGKGAVAIAMPDDQDQVVLIAITDEPVDGAPRPGGEPRTGKIKLAAKLRAE